MESRVVCVQMLGLSKVNVHWFPSHMARGLQAMERRLNKVDLIVEVRDARIPFSSGNPLLEALSRTKKRLVVFNKTDLSEPTENKKLKLFLQTHSKVDFMMMDSMKRNEMTHLLEKIKFFFLSEAQVLPERRFKLIIAGMPNVGKSTIINRLRAIGTSIGGKAVRTGSLPGVTRAVSEIIRISPFPKIYMLDTPGVLMPKISDPEVGLKIALTGGMMDRAVGEYLVAEYLLQYLNSNDASDAYVKKYGLDEPENDVTVFLSKVTSKMKLIDQGLPNIANALAVFLKHFRRGEFGRFTLDKIPDV